MMMMCTSALPSNSYTWYWLAYALCMELVICSIHSCIHHHHLHPNTKKEDMDQTVSRPSSSWCSLLVAFYYHCYYYQPSTCSIIIIMPQDTHYYYYYWMGANVCSEWSCLLSPLFIHASIIITWIEIQANAWWCSPPGSILLLLPTNNNNVQHTHSNIHSTNANMYSAWSCWSSLFIHAFSITSCIQIQAETWTK